MGKRQLQRQEAVCREHLHALESAVDLGAIATVHQLCMLLAAERQRPIHLEARPLPPPLAGLWLATRTTDYIFYADDAPPPLQEHTVLHELAHVLLGLQEAVPPHLDAWEAPVPVPALTPEVVLAALTRSCYDDEQESMAELLGTLIEQRWRTARRDIDGALQAPVRPDIRWLSEQAGDER
jgi:hypothetical protein